MHINLFNLIKLNDFEVMELSNKDRDFVENQNCLVVRVAGEDGESFSDLIKCILDQMTVLKLSNEFLDLDKIREDNGIPEEATVKCSCFGKGMAEWTFQCPEEKTLKFTKKELKEKYVFKSKQDYYVCRIKPVFWGDDIEIHEAVCNLLGKIKPHTFYRLGEKEISAIEEASAIFDPGDLQLDKGIMTYYVTD